MKGLCSRLPHPRYPFFLVRGGFRQQCVYKRSMNTWHSLDVPRTELRLNTTLKCGQSFRWRTTGENEWTGVLRDRIITLQQSDHDVLFKADEGSVGATREILKDYFQLDVNLGALYARWNQDQNFKKKSGEFAGIRILRQDPFENLFAFICSSNNSISRITLMVNKMSERWGTYIGTVEGDSQPYYSFPTLSRLAEDGVESELRNLGFGYRAKYIAQTAKYILQNHDEKWLESLRYVEYAQCREELMKLSGVGPKVADCVCLMSLDKHESIPVDTHVWQIAKRDYKISGLAAAKSLTPKNYLAIGDFFREIFGDYAGWAHSVIFTADLRQFGEKSKTAVVETETIRIVKEETSSFKEKRTTVKQETTVIKTEIDNSANDHAEAGKSHMPAKTIMAFPRRKIRKVVQSDLEIKLNVASRAKRRKMED